MVFFWLSCFLHIIYVFSTNFFENIFGPKIQKNSNPIQRKPNFFFFGLDRTHFSLFFWIGLDWIRFLIFSLDWIGFRLVFQFYFGVGLDCIIIFFFFGVGFSKKSNPVKIGLDSSGFRDSNHHCIIELKSADKMIKKHFFARILKTTSQNLKKKGVQK